MSDFSKFDESCEPIIVKTNSLSKYKSKRNLKKSPEPKGKKEKEKNKYRFVIQLHKAEKAGDHFDLRLENDKGSMTSWVIPKNHLPKNKEKLLAIKTENHPISYMDFKGIIPEGYGKGKVSIHDSGVYEEIEKESSKIVFKLNGKKEKGTYVLFKTNKNYWLLMKSVKEASFPLSIRAASNYIDKRKEESGNITYIYSEKYIAKRQADKEKKLRAFSKSLVSLRKKVKKDMNSKDDKLEILALAVGLIDDIYLRVGNNESASELEHYGLTTLLKKHITFSGGKAHIKYVGKAGVDQDKIVTDKRKVVLLKRICSNKKPNDRLFGGDAYNVRAIHINDYLKPFNISAKDIRGFHANNEMLKELSKVRKGKLPKDEKEKTKKLKEEFTKALEVTAKKVGHQPNTLKNQYLIPSIEPDYLKNGKIEFFADDYLFLID